MEFKKFNQKDLKAMGYNIPKERVDLVNSMLYVLFCAQNEWKENNTNSGEPDLTVPLDNIKKTAKD